MKKDTVLLVIFMLVPCFIKSDTVKVLIYSDRCGNDIQVKHLETGRTIRKEGCIGRGKYLFSSKNSERRVRGILFVKKTGRCSRFYIEMDTEYYVACVLAGEFNHEMFNINAARALSVVIRTFVYENKKRHKDFDFCEFTHCQRFKGEPRNFAMWEEITRSTEGEILVKGKIFKKKIAFYSACCGGYIEEPESVWGNENKRFKSDYYGGITLCAGHHYYRWKKEINSKEIAEVLSEMLRIAVNDILDFSIYKILPSGRVKKIKIIYRSNNRVRKEVVGAERFFSEFGKKYHWARVPSRLFAVSKRGNKFILYGKGQGHGVGLCMAGASEMGRMGVGYREILRHYFPGAEIRQVRNVVFKNR